MHSLVIPSDIAVVVGCYNIGAVDMCIEDGRLDDFDIRWNVRHKQTLAMLHSSV